VLPVASYSVTFIFRLYYILIKYMGGGMTKLCERESAHMRDRRVAHRVFVGRSERKGPLARPRSRWEDNNQMAAQYVE
jgi:hypothetical protein